ncbi:DUF427 domain-containing protein [Sphingomonas montanisoli]|uniref:DUF427 domain-containing protein n=1 Tax=Sphingomonas montanisoli TaxID=2606412 RepID=A0A5D9C360_9SPHN|nr:DUF427 domain-containing protein [Sphingomonas montanisoli]TZG26109.1 DUF427 domain-containing protein [Sphingomonas montanisoli]
MSEDVSGYGARFDYRVDIMRRRNLLTATSKAGVELARSERALLVDEQNHGLVFYFPEGDVDLAKLARIPDRTSYCPYKGHASYWGLAGEEGEPVAWAYETPYPQVAQITGHIAFYQNRVTVSIGIAAALVKGA